MDNLSYIIGLNNGEGGGGASSWSDIDGKPFNTVGTGLTTTGKVLAIDSTVVTDSDLATVATTGDYDDLTNKPTIPSATQVTVTQGLSSGVTVGSIDVNGITTVLYAPQGGTGVTPDWSATSGQDGYIANKPDVYSGAGTSSIIEGVSSLANGNASHAEGVGSIANGLYQHVQGVMNIIDTQGTTTTLGKFADIVGNGVDGQTRSNAEATDWSGNKYLAGDVYTHVTNWGTTPTVGAIKLEPVSVTQTLQSGTAIADLTIGNTTTTLYAPAGGGGSVDIDNKSIVMNADDELETAVPLYSEQVASAYGPGLLLNGPVYDDDEDDFDANHNMPSSSYLVLTESDDAYTVMADIDGTVYSGIWNSNYDESHAYGGWAHWHVTSPIDSYWEFYIENEEEEGTYRQRFHIYPDGMEVEVLNWLLIAPNDPDNEQYITEANVESYNYTWGSKPYTQTIYHKLPLSYTSIEACRPNDNPLVYVDNGIMKIRKPVGGQNMTINGVGDTLEIVYNAPQPLLNVQLLYSNGELSAKEFNSWYDEMYASFDAQALSKPPMVWIYDETNGITYLLNFEKYHYDSQNDVPVWVFKNSSLTLTLTGHDWASTGDINDSGLNWDEHIV